MGEVVAPKAERIRGRLVEIELSETPGLGWVAVGIVRQGLAHERGMVFDGTGRDSDDAETKLKAEIEAFFG